MVDQERRTNERVNVERLCKLYLPRAGKYVSGSTWNVSPGGVMLHLDIATNISAGDRLYVGIAFKRRQAVLASNEMIEAEVVRVDQADGDRIAVAARFVEERTVYVPVLRRAA
jgi:hypothetical protein